jgi:hypothetical protein
MNTMLILGVTMTILSLDYRILMQPVRGEDNPLSIAFWSDVLSLVGHMLGRAFTAGVIMLSLFHSHS